MVDTLSPTRRSWNMSRIRSRDTGPEIRVRSALHALGFRFRFRSSKDLPGRPDIILPKHRTIIFVHGCFWHRHPACPLAYTPKTRTGFWQQKFAENMERDRKVEAQLEALGWTSIVIWECETEDRKGLLALLDVLLRAQRRRCIFAEVARSVGCRIASSDEDRR